MQNNNPYAQGPQQNYQQPQNQYGSNQPVTKKSHLKLIAIIAGLLAVLFLALLIWQMLSLSNERTNRDNLVAEEVEQASEVIRGELRAEFDEEAKLPLRTYNSPASLGSVVLKYPKTWSATVDENGSSSNPFSFTAHPSFVPEGDIAFGLRATIINDEYSDEVSDYQKDIEKGLIKSRVFKNSGETGVRLNGAIDKFNGSMVILPLREKTLKIWTESSQYNSDFEKALSGLKYEP